MIFYFSATGNCKYVASEIAKEIGEEIVSITDCINKNIYKFKLKNNEKIGFVTPTYFWGLPTIVCDFFDRFELELENSYKPYIFHVTTFGSSSGQTNNIVMNYLDKKKLILNGKFAVLMPDTWTPIFDLSDKVKVDKINQNAEEQITIIKKQIKENQNGDFGKLKVPKILVKLFYSLYESFRKTKKFKVEDSCIGCKICAKNCPIGAIEIQNQKPVWVKDKCVLCLGCLHHCPKFSIQYGKKTKKHGQYVNPNI